MTPALLDHLWQSTLFALGAGLLVLLFRKASAAVRHGLWFAASAKFLIPFAALAAAGGLLAPQLRLPAPAVPQAALIAKAAQPFSEALAPSPLPQPRAAPPERPQVQVQPSQAPPSPAEGAPAHQKAPAPAPPAAARVAVRLDWGLILMTAWALGSSAIVARWALHWRRLRKAIRSARRLDWPAPMPVLASPWLVEPALVGVVRPVLVLAETLPERLSRSEIDAILAHEIAHLRRRDNLTGALHMLVEALFWFHPLVWWIGGRLTAERERACDEAVVRAGHDRAAYARSLVESCRHYLQSPLDCVAGASGSSLKMRVEAIMSAPLSAPLPRSKKALLLAFAAFAFATPVAAGLLVSPEIGPGAEQDPAPLAKAMAAIAAPAKALGVLSAAPTLAAPDADGPAQAVILAQGGAALAPAPSLAPAAAAPVALSREVAAPPVQLAPQDAPAPRAETPPADLGAEATSFVEAYAETTPEKHLIARWVAPISVRVVGLTDDQAAAVKARIEEIARQAGAPVRVGPSPPSGSERNNIEIGFTTRPQAMLDEAVKRAPRALGDRTSGTQGAKSVTRPIQAWYVTNGQELAANDANGLKALAADRRPWNGAGRDGLKVLVASAPIGATFTPGYGTFSPPGNPPSSEPYQGENFGSSFPGEGALGFGAWQPGPRQFVNAMVIVDVTKTDGLRLGALTDYAAMLALAQPRSSDGCKPLPSITDLFAACPGRAAPEGVTPADMAYLKALYAQTRVAASKQSDVAEHMAKLLADAAPLKHDAAWSASALAAPARPPLIRVAATAEPAGVKSEASAFIKSYGPAYWNTDNLLCFRVEGLAADKAEAVKARVEADARAAGVSVGRAECGIRRQVEIRFSADADRAVREVLDYDNHPMWPLPWEKPQGAGRPIRAWYGVVYDHAGADERRRPDSEPDDRGLTKLALAIVVVDPARTQGLSLDLVSDYVAMLALAQPRALDHCNVLPSVTDLYAGACPGRAAPTGLTRADAAYLKALYAGSPGLRATRYASELVDHMAKLLAEAAPPKAGPPSPAA